MYSTDGSVHYSGINTEKETIQFLNDIKFYSEPLVHLGGTKNKADAIAVYLSIGSNSDAWLNLQKKHPVQILCMLWLQKSWVENV